MSGLKYISVTQEGTLWGAQKPDGKLFRYYGGAAAENWIGDRDGSGDVVAAISTGGLWCVNNKHEIWYTKDIVLEGGVGA